MAISAIIVAAGTGSRAGTGPAKQLRLLHGRRVLDWSLEAFAAHELIDTVILVAPASEVETYSEMFRAADRVVAGGATRSLSVRAGLVAAKAAGSETVLVHDAARPGLDKRTITALIEALQSHDGAAPALPVVDALKRTDASGRLSNVRRDGLYRVQTPQAFRLELLERAIHEAPDSIVDDLEAVERLGARIAFVDGHERLAKITYQEDFDRMERLLAPLSGPRIGTGFDVHAFEPGDAVILCGLAIPHTARLQGHSDADVAWHALTDAILGAIGAGDIGDHFPPSDEKWRGAPSRVFLEEAMRLAREAGYELGNCDITLICEVPKIKPHRETMRQQTAEVLGVDMGRVSLKATTTEGLGFTGRREGIAAQAAAILYPAQ